MNAVLFDIVAGIVLHEGVMVEWLLVTIRSIKNMLALAPYFIDVIFFNLQMSVLISFDLYLIVSASLSSMFQIVLDCMHDKLIA